MWCTMESLKRKENKEDKKRSALLDLQSVTVSASLVSLACLEQLLWMSATGKNNEEHTIWSAIMTVLQYTIVLL